MEENFNWDVFLQPYELAISGFIIKLESMKKQYILQQMKNPIESITGRVKTPNSILEKARRINVKFADIPEKIQDIAGIRILCKYIADVYRVYDLLASRKDIEIVSLKDYIKEPKPSGYRSLHIIAKYNVETLEGQQSIYIEFQIRTLAMHLWASIEHSLKYKYYRNIPESIKKRLQAAAKITTDLDNEMSNIQHEVETLENGNGREDYEIEWELNTIHRGKL
jgi:putative GTP pyrophosphokinase